MDTILVIEDKESMRSMLKQTLEGEGFEVVLAEGYKTQPDLIKKIDRLLDHATDAVVAAQLNQQGIRSALGRPFTARRVASIRRNHKLKTRYQRVREKGLMTSKEIAQQLKVCTQTVQVWRDHGLLRAHTYSSKGECLYEPPPSDNLPKKQQGLTCPLRDRAAIPLQSNQRGAV